MTVKELLLRQDVEKVIEYMKANYIGEYEDREKLEYNFENYFPLTFEDIKKTDPIIPGEMMIFGYQSKDLDYDDEIETSPDIFAFNREDLEKMETDYEINTYEELYENHDKKHFPTSYGLMFLDWEEMLGYEVIEDFSQVSELEIACIILWELTFFGYTKEDYDERVSEEKAILDASMEDVEKAIETGDNSKFRSFDEFKEELYAELYPDMTEEEKEEKRKQEEIEREKRTELYKILAVENFKNQFEMLKWIKNEM